MAASLPMHGFAGFGSQAIDLARNKFNQAIDQADEALTSANDYLYDLSAEANKLEVLAAKLNYANLIGNLNITAAEMGDVGEAPNDTDLDAIPDIPVNPGIVYNTYTFDKELTLSIAFPDKPTYPSLDEIPVVVADTIVLLESKINTRLTDGVTGLDADVEAAIWARARSRQELENINKYQEVENYYSSRGFSIPPGTLSGKLNELLIEFARNDSYLNNDILIKQAELAMQNENVMLESGIKYIIERLTQNASVIIEGNKLKIQGYLGELEGYKAEIQAEIARIDALTKVYMAELEAYKGKIEAEAVRVESMSKIYIADTQVYTATADAIVKTYLGRIEAYKGRIQAESAKVDAVIKSLDLALRQVIAVAETDMKEAAIDSENLKNATALAIELTKGGAQIAAQLAASAMSSVNASASVGGSGSESQSLNDNFSTASDTTKDTPTTSHNYNYNASV
jgi:hypothetical protein